MQKISHQNAMKKKGKEYYMIVDNFTNGMKTEYVESWLMTN